MVLVCFGLRWQDLLLSISKFVSKLLSKFGMFTFVVSDTMSFILVFP